MFRTPLTLDECSLKLDETSKFLFIGSCFAVEIGHKLISLGLNTLINPLGIAFNPISTANHINDNFDQSDIIHHQGIWHSLKHHSNFSSMTKEDLYRKIKKHQIELKKRLKECQLLVISFGSSYYYEYNKTKRPVTNCHKIPQKEFSKKMLEIHEIVDLWDSTLAELKNQNPKIQVLLTVSPIRHLKDGLVNNTRSKSRLIESCHQLCENNKFAYYFPSFELMMDDLRDYRFYGRDHLHPSPEAVDYIWEFWKKRHCDMKFTQYLNEIAKYKSTFDHKTKIAFGTVYEQHQQWLSKEKTRLEGIYPDNMNRIQP